MFMSGPSTTRVIAHALIRSISPGSPASPIGVSGFARKFWTITSWMWPNSSCNARIASSASMRSCCGLPDPDEDARRERNLQETGLANHREPRRGPLVRGVLVRATGRAEPVGDGLEHDALAGRDRPELLQLAV